MVGGYRREAGSKSYVRYQLSAISGQLTNVQTLSFSLLSYAFCLPLPASRLPHMGGFP